MKSRMRENCTSGSVRGSRQSLHSRNYVKGVSRLSTRLTDMRTKEELPECPVATAVSLIGGKWKLLLLRNLKERPWRFNELQRSIDGISQKVLTESLRQMIDDGLAYRRDYHENPPKVEYGLTDLGTEMLPIVNALADFGNYYKSVVDRS